VDAAARSGQAIQVLVVEYQGNFVKVMLDVTGDDELVACIPERMIFSDPTTIGDVVQATWHATWHATWPCHLARPLAKTSSPTA
jgi:hypothetical protein